MTNNMRMDNSKTILVKSIDIPEEKRNVTQIGNYVVTNKRLGRGASATVYLGYNDLSKLDVAVKKFEITNNNKRIERRAWREIKILQNILHPNIIKMYDYFHDKDKNDIYIFLEYCPIGSIKTFLGRGGYLDEKYVNRLMRQFISGLKYLFSLGIYHRDIKPDNLLLSKNYNLKISDFGLATINKSGQFNRLCGSPLYMAPEILISATYDKNSDIWSIGLVMFELLFGHHPLRNIKNITDLIKFYTNKNKLVIPPNEKPDDVNLSEECIDLLQKILVSDIKYRISWEELFRHPWVFLKIFNESDTLKNINNKYDDDNEKDKNQDDNSSFNSNNSSINKKIGNKNYNLDIGNSSNTTSDKNIKNSQKLLKISNDNWSPIYLPLPKWKYNKKISKNYNNLICEIHYTDLLEDTYLSQSFTLEQIQELIKNKCFLIKNESTSVNMCVKKNNNILNNETEPILLSTNITFNLCKKYVKLISTDPNYNNKKQVPFNFILIGNQTWPLHHLLI